MLYMLRDLHLAYWGYGSWLAAGILGQLLTLRAWGRFADRFGNKALLTVTGFMVPFLPMLYLAGTNLLFLLFVNFLGGVTWGGLALGLQNYVFDAVRPEDRAKAVATYSTINAVGWCLGALMGSWLVHVLPSGITIGRYSLLREVEQRRVIAGHTHMQLERCVGDKLFVNAGSIGWPYEGQPGAYWAILDEGVELRHTEYDLERAAELVRASGHPRAEEIAAENILVSAPRAEALALFGG